MKLLNDEIVIQLRGVFDSQFNLPVEIIHFSKDDKCDEIVFLLDEISSLTDKLHISHYNLETYPKLAETYAVEQAPCLVVAGRDGDDLIDYGVHFYGLPSGFEFGSLIQGIIQVSRRDSGLIPESRERLKALTQPVHLKVFVTPT